MTRLYTAASVALAFTGVLALSMVDAEAGKQARRFKERKDLVVTLLTPTNNQEVLPDLSDPGLNNVITVRFSSSLRPRDVINPNNVFNRLTNRVEFLDANFARMPGTPRVRRNVFTFDPRTSTNGGLLPNGQYTINLKKSLRNRRGRLLNKGVRDFTSTFSVGTDVYSPVLRKISPIEGQRNIGLTQRIIATFNEPIDPNSAIATVQVQDASVNPPLAIPGDGGGTGVTVERNGFDLVFTPDPCFGYPPNTTIQMLIQGLDHPLPIGSPPTATPLTDAFGNPFDRDPGLQWALNVATNLHESPNGSYHEQSGIFRMTFQTKGVRPRPQGLIPGSPQNPTFIPGATPCARLSWFAPSCVFAGNLFFYTTANGLGEVSMQGFINRFNQGITDFSLFSVVPNSPQRHGRPGTGFMVDPRFDAADFHTFLYLVDERTRSVKVLDSHNLATLGRFGGVVQPRDLTISTDGGLNRTTLWITDFGAGSVVGLDLQAITVDFSGQPGAPSPCDAIRDQQSRRVIIQTGRGPTGVAANSYFLSRVMVCNTLDASITQINPRDNSIRNTLDVGSSPVDCDWSLFGGAGDVCMIANQGGLTDPNGSISLYVRTGATGDFRGGFISAGQQRDGVESSLTDGVNNPTGIWGNQQWSFAGFSSPNVWYAANTGGKTVMQLGLSSTGIAGLFAIAFVPGVTSTAEVGFNPTSAMTDSFYPGAFAFAAVAGTGSLAAWDPARPLSPTMNPVPGIRRIFTCFSH